MLVPIVLGAAVGAFVLGSSRLFPRPISDRAQTGDEVYIDVTALPAGGLPPAIPAGAGTLVMTVQGADDTHVSGPIIGFAVSNVRTLLNTPVGPVRVPRAVIQRVFRGGREVPNHDRAVAAR